MIIATERIAYGYVDTRAVWGSPTQEWWHVIWMAVSCCNGWEGPTERIPK